MPKIHTITTDSAITSSDKLLGSDGAAGANNATKNYTVGDLKTFILNDTDLYAFKTLSVSGQSDVVADAKTDTLTLAEGSNITITTNSATDTVTIASTDTNTTYTAGDGLDLTSTEFAVDTTVIRTTGDQTLTGVKTFSSSIVGDLTGDVTGDLTGNVTGDLTGDVTGNITGDVTGDLTGDVTGNVTGNLTGNVTGDLTGNVTGNVTGNLTGNPTVGEIIFSSTLGKIKEASVTVSSVDLTALNGGGNYTLIAAPGPNRAIIPISVTIESDPGATSFNFNEDLYIGHENEVSSTTTDYFVAVGASFINATTIEWRHFPFTKAVNEYVSIRPNDPLMLHATSTATVTAGNGDIKVKIVYREVDFT